MHYVLAPFQPSPFASVIQTHGTYVALVWCVARFRVCSACITSANLRQCEAEEKRHEQRGEWVRAVLNEEHIRDDDADNGGARTRPRRAGGEKPLRRNVRQEQNCAHDEGYHDAEDGDLVFIMFGFAAARPSADARARRQPRPRFQIRRCTPAAFIQRVARGNPLAQRRGVKHAVYSAAPARWPLGHGYRAVYALPPIPKRSENDKRTVRRTYYPLNKSIDCPNR